MADESRAPPLIPVGVSAIRKVDLGGPQGGWPLKPLASKSVRPDPAEAAKALTKKIRCQEKAPPRERFLPPSSPSGFFQSYGPQRERQKGEPDIQARGRCLS